ncbi:MAG TPA: alpha/beta hydrolase [Anaerolineales bacterium]|nr:alpha/beta hydrolase [Anaerolineales bacterium]HNN12990.1 alpha/beta hydrolase [Anaerolineales bacterium]
MKRFSRTLSFISAFFGLFTLLRSPKGRLGGAVWIPKLWAGAWAPWLAFLGGVGAFFSLLRGDAAGALTGGFGLLAGVRHTVRVTKRGFDPFAEAFGADWEQRIHPERWMRLNRPYQWLQPNFSLGAYQKDVNIGGAAPLLCDLWLPPSEVPSSRLGLIFLHGGLWQAVGKDFLTRPFFARLVNQGHVVMDVAYSLAPSVNIFQMMDEVKRSIVWMKSNAARLGIDSERVVLAGSSGGAHLALLAAYTPNVRKFQPKGLRGDTSVRGVISIHGIADIVSFFHEYGETNPRQPRTSEQITEDMLPRLYNRTWMDRLMTRSRAFPEFRYSNMPGGDLLLVNLFGGPLEESRETYRQYSPITHVGPHCPPTLLLAAEEDFVTTASHSRRLHTALQKANVPSVYIEFPESVHAFDQYFGVSRRVAPAAQMAANDIEQFLALLV